METVTRTRLFAEFIGTMLLLATLVGSGIMAERLAGGNVAVALLANAIATGVMLVVLITIFAPLSGAHFNPAVTLVDSLGGGMTARLAAGYLLVQVAGAFAGVLLAHGMFELPAITPSQHVRAGAAQALSELVATFGLVLTILLAARHAREKIAVLVGCYITAAYWFTASTSFANPAVTLARAATDSFSGIRPEDAPLFILAQLAGALLAVGVARGLQVKTTTV